MPTTPITFKEHVKCKHSTWSAVLYGS